MIKKNSILRALFIFLITFSANSQTLNTGPWKFELKAHHGTIPFVIDVKKTNDNFEGILFNGKEKIKLTNIHFENGQIIIPLQSFEMSLEMSHQRKGKLAGYLIRHNKNPKTKTPVIATFGINERFQQKYFTPEIDLNGKWSITLTDENNKIENGVIIFQQNINKLNGTILTPTGDYRYFEGFVSGSDFTAASFDGVYNYLLKGNVKDDLLTANILSNYKTVIQGTKNPKAELPDAYNQTKLESLEFEFQDLDGKKISLKDEKFKNKPIIVQFFGSWCPNCLDETNFLIPWYNKNQKRGVEVIALAFERSLGVEEARRQLKKTKTKFNIPYTILMAGATSEEKPKDKIKGLKNFISFPTTVFLNRKHEVVKVHAGFSGPSTGEFFEKWKDEFNQIVNEMLKK